MSQNHRVKTRHLVCKVAELPAGSRKIVRVPAFGRELEIGVFNVDGTVVAYRNICPHAGAPVCEGPVCGTTLPSGVYEYSLARHNEIVRCPWHGWEFALLTGEHLVDEKMKLRGYTVETQNENLEGFEIEREDETIYVLI